MEDFIKGDTLLIKELTDELNRLRQENGKLLDELNATKLTLASKEQERLDALNDNKYYKNMFLELTYSQNQTAIAELNKVRELMTKKVDSIKNESLKLSFRTFVFTLSNAIDLRINVLKGETNETNERISK